MTVRHSSSNGHPKAKKPHAVRSPKAKKAPRPKKSAHAKAPHAQKKQRVGFVRGHVKVL